MSLLQMAALGAVEKSAEGIAARTRLKAQQAFEEYMRKRKKEDAQELEATRFDNNLKVEEQRNNNANARQQVGFEHDNTLAQTKHGLRLAEQDALIAKQQGLLSDSKVTDQWLDEEGNLSDQGKGVPQFQRKPDGTLIDLRAKPSKTGEKEEAEYYKALLKNKYDQVTELQKSNLGGEYSEQINNIGQEIQMIEDVLYNKLGVNRPKKLDPETLISTFMQTEGVSREDAIRTLATHPKYGEHFKAMANELEQKPEPKKPTIGDAIFGP